MTWKLIFTKQYTRRAARFLKRHSDLESVYLKALQLLEANPKHPSLRLHPLKGKFSGLHSISINISFRITIEFIMSEKEIILINVGDHDDVYS